MESEVYVGGGALVRPRLGDQVLGAGIGETAKTLATDHKRWVCLEPDRRMASHIAERISARDLPAICEARVGTIDDIGEQDFSAVLYIDVLEHIMPVRLSERGALNRRCAAMSCSRFCLVSI
jgi:hypothetical protein